MAAAYKTAAIASLQTALQNVANLIAEITANPKPSYSIDGQSVSWESYLATLTAQLRNIEEALQRMQPYVVRTKISY